MKVVVLPRRGGKTEAMLRWMQEAPESEHRICISPTLMESHRVQRLALERGLPLESWQFVSLGEVFGLAPGLWSGVVRGRGGHIVLGLDNVDLILRCMFRWPVGAVTLTPEDGA